MRKTDACSNLSAFVMNWVQSKRVGIHEATLLHGQKPFHLTSQPDGSAYFFVDIKSALSNNPALFFW